MPGCLNLITQYVNDPRPARQAEFEECFRRNLANPFVSSVHNLQERADVKVPAEFAGHAKYVQHDLKRWMTFADAFGYANANLVGKVCGIINLDVFLDPTSPWQEMPVIFNDPMVFCLTRHEYDLDGRTWIDPTIDNWQMANSQDAWFFKAPITVKNCDFGVGVMGCDNAIAHRIKESNYLPVNAARRFRIFHLDRVRGKTVANHEQIYLQERKRAALGSFPERQGQYLLPEIESFQGVDEVLARLNVNPMGKYAMICDAVNKFVRLDNMPGKNCDRLRGL